MGGVKEKKRGGRLKDRDTQTDSGTQSKTENVLYLPVFRKITLGWGLKLSAGNLFEFLI